MDQDRMLAAHPLPIFALDAAVIAEIATAVCLGVGVDDLAIKTGLGHAKPVIVMHDGRGVDDKRNHIAGARFSQERNNTVIGIVKINPLKACVTVVLVPQ